MLTAARRGTRTTIWTAAIAAFVFHMALLGSVEAFDLNVVGQGFKATKDAKGTGADLTELKAGCVADALLASSARFTLCYAPWRDDTDACVDAADLDMRIDISTCQAMHDSDAMASVALIEPKQAQKITPIDPEPLIEAMKEEPPKPKPPEIKPPQPEQQKPPPPPPPSPPPQARRSQIVETAKPNTDKEPENARFVSEFNTVAEKEKVARGAVKEPMVAKSKPEELTPKENPKEASIEKQDEDRARGANKTAPDVPGTLAMRNPGVQRPADLQQDAKTVGSFAGATGPLAFDGFMPRRGDGAFEQQQKQRSEIPKGQNGAGGGTPDLNLKPSHEVLERALGGGSVDHYDDVLSGDETAVNSKRWVHASFFNRLKRSVAQNWDPGSVWRRSDPDGKVYGFKTRVTEIRVSLSTNGQLAKVVVTGPSGVTELDDEAVRAFQAAGPFPNPPKELANSEGLITFAFAFYFEIGQPSSSWRVVRSM